MQNQKIISPISNFENDYVRVQGIIKAKLEAAVYKNRRDSEEYLFVLREHGGRIKISVPGDWGSCNVYLRFWMDFISQAL